METNKHTQNNAPVNQGDGCRMKQPIENDLHVYTHVSGAKSYTSCTKDRYASPVQQEGKKCESDGLLYLSYPPKEKCKNCGRFWKQKDQPPVCINPPEEAQENSKCEHGNWKENGCRLGCFSAPQNDEWEEELENRFKNMFDLIEIQCLVSERTAMKLFIFQAIQKAREEEKEYWMNQKSNVHDNAIRQEERSRLIALAETIQSRFGFSKPLNDFIAKVRATNEENK